MNTRVEFIAWSDLDRNEIHNTFNKGYKQFHHVVKEFSRFDKSSQLSRLNEKSGKNVAVSKELFNLVKFSLTLAEKTNGAFDPTIIDLLEAYGYGIELNFEKLENRNRLQKEISKILKNRPSYKDIKLNQKNLTIKLQPSQRIDLGGIGKGYAVDLAFQKLRPLKNFLINAGGDIRVRGSDRDQKPWLIGLKDPELGQLKATRLENKAICSSGRYARKVKYFHHLINPKTGNPQNSLQTIFVKAKTCCEADGWATALFVDSKNIKNHAKLNNLVVYIVRNDSKQINTFD